jgi:two-component system response regulator NreC
LTTVSNGEGQDGKIRVLVADDHKMARAGLCLLLRLEPDFEVIGEASDGYEALTLASELQPNVVLADVSMPGPGGVEIARQLQSLSPAVRVVVLTMHEDTNLAREALEAGAGGYIVKRAAEIKLIAAIRAVAAGQVYVDEDVALSTMAGRVNGARSGSDGADRGPALSLSEARLLGLLAQGLSMQQAAQAMNLDVIALEQLRDEVTGRLGLHSRVEIVRFARDYGLTETGPW